MWQKTMNHTFSMVYLTNRFRVAVRLFSNRSQMTSKCGKNKKVAHEGQPSVSSNVVRFQYQYTIYCEFYYFYLFKGYLCQY